MKQPDTSSLGKSVTFSIIVAMLLFIIVVAVTTVLIQKNHQDQYEQIHDAQLHHSIEYTIKQYLNEYTYRIRRMIQTTTLPELLKERDREGIYRLLKAKWELMHEEEPDLTIMQVHLPDGSTFLRMHQPEHFGDQLTYLRPIIKDIHRSHQMISGYETGKYGTSYRIIAPIFDTDQTYIGSFEMGLNPNFVLRTIHELNNFTGLIFVKEDDPKYFDGPNDLMIDGYRLQSDLTPELKAIYETITPLNLLENHTQITVGNKRYLDHLFIFNDFKDQPRVKILIFQDISEEGLLRDHLFIWLLISMGIILLLLIWFVYHRIANYQNDVRQVYHEQMEELNKSEHLLMESQKLAHIGSWELDIVSDTLFWSEETYRIFELDPENFAATYDTFLDAIHPDDRKMVDLAYRDSLENQTPYELIHRILMKDGRIKFVQERCKTFFDTDGKALHSVGTAQDITEQKQLQNKLRASKHQFDLFMENIPANVTIKDHNDHIIYANASSTRFFNRENIVGLDAYDLLPKQYADKLHALNTKAKAEGYAEELLKFVNEAGEIFFFRVLVFAIPQPDQNRLHSGSIYLDITKQYKEHKEIIKFRQVLEKSPVSIVITDVDGNIEYVNPWFCRLTGYSLKEAIGQNPRILKSGHTSAEEYRALWKEISHGHVWSGIFKNIKKNDEEYWESSIIAPIKNEIGEIVNYIGIKQEITEKVHLKKELVKQEEKTHELGSILEESLNEIYIFDKNSWKFLYANKGAQNNIGYSLKELIKLTPYDLAPEMTEKKFSELLKPLNQKETGKIFFSMSNQRKDGTIYPVDVYLQQIVFEGRNAYMSIIADMTEREKIRKELQSQEEIMISQSRHAAMGEMIGMIAHQWRQPITVIAMGANNTLLDIELDNLSAESCKKQAQRILKQTEYLSKTIDDFRNFFRPDKEKEVIKVEDVMSEAEKIIGKSLENNGVKLTITNRKGYTVETYSRELLQVFINLLKNAKEALVEHREKDRHIDVIISDNGDSVITTVCDNGGGIDVSIIDRIFDPYFSTKDEKSGTGLGLYMSKTIVEKHLHGTIEVSNTKEGACFKIAIPIAEKGK